MSIGEQTSKRTAKKHKAKEEGVTLRAIVKKKKKKEGENYQKQEKQDNMTKPTSSVFSSLEVFMVRCLQSGRAPLVEKKKKGSLVLFSALP